MEFNYNMTVKEVNELSRRQLTEMMEIETLVFEEDEKDVEFFEFYKTIERKSLNEIVKEAKEQKLNDDFSDVKMFSKVFKFNVKKILGYNEVHYKVDKVAYFNQKYKDYRNEIKEQIQEEMKPFLNHKNVKVDISFFINYNQKDLDNLEYVIEQVFKANYKKAFLDSLYNDQDGDDNMIRKINTEMFKTDGEEFILIKFETLTDREVYQSELLREYNKQ